MTEYKRHRETLAEKVGEKWIDVVLMQFIRTHVRTEHIADVVEFCSSTVQWGQLQILLKHVGTGRQPLVNELTVDSWQNGTFINARIIGDPMSSFAGEVVIRGLRVPETLTNSDRLRVGDVVDHPYLPADLHMEGIGQSGDTFSFRLKAP